MGWSLGFDPTWRRDIGYGVPAVCDDPECTKEIDRGLSYVCGGEPYGGECGCGLYFCGKHLSCGDEGRQVCARCLEGKEPYKPKPDSREWLEHKLKHRSWKAWRADEPAEVAMIKAALAPTPPVTPNLAQGGEL